MTTQRRGRGRPTLFTEPLRAAYLAARATGATQEKAAATAGVPARTVRYTRKTDTAFRERDDAAAATGHLARHGHGEYAYNHLRCRCRICTKAASTARVDRRHPAAADTGPPPQETGQGAPVVAISPPATRGSKDFPLARAS